VRESERPASARPRSEVVENQTIHYPPAQAADTTTTIARRKTR